MASGANVILRSWRDTDIDALVRYANNRKIWINLRDRFPHPYTRADAESWIAHCDAQHGPATQFAIHLGEEAIGGIGFEILSDVHRLTAEIGYWLGEPFWGRGVATAALTSATAHAFARFPLQRLQAMVFEWNPASVRVLEKAGYVFEGRLRRSVFKAGQMADCLLYARFRA